MPDKKLGVCPLCDREATLTFHHLIPRKVHRRAHFKKNYSRDELKQGINICRPCHTGIHKRLTEMELAKQLRSLDDLRNHEELAHYFKWVSRQRIRN